MKNICNILKNWMRDTDGVAATEMALVMPVLAMMLLGVFDLGRGLLVNQKVISASQIGASLIARNMSVDQNIIDETIEGAQLALQPYNVDSFGIDIVSLAFDENEQPEVLWRETRNMAPNDESVLNTAGVFPEGEGVIIVTVAYTYVPSFGNFVIPEVTMREIAFSRGRRSATVGMN